MVDLRRGSRVLVGICRGRGFRLCGLSPHELRDGNRRLVASGVHSYQEGISLGLALGMRCCAEMGLLCPWSPNARSSLLRRDLHRPSTPASRRMAICSSPGCSIILINFPLLQDQVAASATAYKIDFPPAQLNSSASYSNYPTSASSANWIY